MPMEEEPNPPATFAVQSAPIAKPMYIAVLPFRVPEMYKRLGGEVAPLAGVRFPDPLH